MNSLEDAYLNIAKEEEKLLETVILKKQSGPERKFSINNKEEGMSDSTNEKYDLSN